MEQYFTQRSEVIAFLRKETPVQWQHLFDDDRHISLLEFFFEAITSEPLVSPIRSDEQSSSGNSGYGAYFRRFKLIVNVKKAALVSTAFIVDLLLTRGLVRFVMSQMIRDPVFVRRLETEQHLMCVLNEEQWSDLTYATFKNSLDESLCKNPVLECKFRDETYHCRITESEMVNAIADLNKFFKVT